MCCNSNTYSANIHADVSQVSLTLLKVTYCYNISRSSLGTRRYEENIVPTVAKLN